MGTSDYLSLDQAQLVNLAHSLNCEILSTNHSGGYMSTSAVLCNTRKYHGLMVLPLDHFGGERHVLLSGLDETIVVDGQEFNLAVRRYKGVFEPRGHKYLESFLIEPTPTFVYRVGSALIRKELLFVHLQDHFMVRYTVLEAENSLRIRLRPFLAFRNAHSLSKANLVADTKYSSQPNGMSCRMYAGFPTLYMQTNIQSEYIHVPDWYYDVEYPAELDRGYEAYEDLYVPGHFESTLRKNQPLVFSASTRRIAPRSIARLFTQEVQMRPMRDDLRTVLEAAAGQFLVDRGRNMQLIAGFPWFGRWGRDTLIALPGLTLPLGDVTAFESVMNSLLREMKGALLPNMGASDDSAFNSVDSPLWLFTAVQSYCQHTGDYARAWSLWGKNMRTIIKQFVSSDALPFGIRMHDNGLMWAGERGFALTWMDAVVYGEAVTPRMGYAVEINALWYNALCFILEIAEKVGYTRLPKEWSVLPEKAAAAFCETFIIPEKGYLADYVDQDGQHHEVRPNQIFAVSLPYSPIPRETQMAVLDTVERELYTPLGLRTLSPKNPAYQGRYQGDQASRDRAYHQGTIWTWLLDAYVEAVEKIKGAGDALVVSQEIMQALEKELHRAGLGSLSEVYDGDPPHNPGGTIAQAWSVAAAMRIFRRVIAK